MAGPHRVRSSVHTFGNEERPPLCGAGVQSLLPTSKKGIDLWTMLPHLPGVAVGQCGSAWTNGNGTTFGST